MVYTLTVTSGHNTIRATAIGRADLVGLIVDRFGSRVDVVPMLHDLLSGLEHVTRVDDCWLIVTIGEIC